MTLFEKIAARQIPANIVYEDETTLAFRDIAPQAPVHILVVPKKPLEMLSAADDGDAALLGQLLLTVKRVAAQEGLTDFRVAINNGAGAGQTVFHLHLHILAGRPFKWPPG